MSLLDYQDDEVTIPTSTIDPAGRKPRQYLFAPGSNVRRGFCSSQTPLQLAAELGDAQSVSGLLEAGAAVNACGDFYGTALQAASHWGHAVVVATLLAAGANINAEGGIYGNALYAAVASFGGHEEVVEILLAADADVNARAGPYGTALQAASFRGNKRIVEMLLLAGADINAQGGIYGDALHAAVASHQRNREVVKTLLEVGAHVDLQYGKSGSVLQAASFGGDTLIVKMLLLAGADVNAKGGIYGNALYAASERGHEKVVEILLAAGADVNVESGYAGNALQSASERGHDGVVKMLLAAGADVNANYGTNGSALYAGSKNGHKEVVRILLAAGADVGARTGKFGTALQAAANNGERDVVTMLIAAGADVNAADGRYGTALRAAASRWANEAVVLALLAAGADVHASGLDFGSPVTEAKIVEARILVNEDAGETGLREAEIKPIYPGLHGLQGQTSWTDEPSLDHALESAGLEADGLDETDAILEPQMHYRRLEVLEIEIARCCLSSSFIQMMKKLSLSAVYILDCPDEELLNLLAEVLENVCLAYSRLKATHFSAGDFSVVVVDQWSLDQKLNVIPIGNDILVGLDLIVSAMTEDEYYRVNDEGFLDSSTPHGDTDLEAATLAILEYLGLSLRCQDLDVPRSWFEDLVNIVVVLALGIVSYAGSHASDLLHRTRPDDFWNLPERWFTSGIVPNSRNTHILFRKLPLNCMAPFVGGSVWAFEALHFKPSTSTSVSRVRSIAMSINSLADLWGPIHVTPNPDDRAMIIAIHTERGTIIAESHDYEDENVARCHWYEWGETLPDTTVSFPADATLLIGSSPTDGSSTQEANVRAAELEDFALNKRCNKPSMKAGAGLTSFGRLIPLGTSSKHVSFEKATVTGGVNKILVATGAIEYKITPGRSRKALLIQDFNSDHPDPTHLKARIGIEISACTGNALRVPLWRIFTLQVVKDWIHLVLPDHLAQNAQEQTQGLTTFLNAFDEGFEAFLTHWRTEEQFRKSAVHIIRRLLEHLSLTGPTVKNAFHAWYVGQEPNGLEIAPEAIQARFKWIKLLSDTRTEAALVVIGDRCIGAYGELCSCGQRSESTALWTSVISYASEDNVARKKPKLKGSRAIKNGGDVYEVPQSGFSRDLQRSNKLMATLGRVLGLRKSENQSTTATPSYTSPEAHSNSRNVHEESSQGSVVTRLSIADCRQSTANSVPPADEAHDLSAPQTLHPAASGTVEFPPSFILAARLAIQPDILATIHKHSGGHVTLYIPDLLPAKQRYPILSLQCRVEAGFLAAMERTHRYQEWTDGRDGPCAGVFKVSIS